ncbi:MAG: acyltransferase family protein [Lachnospiraceae bacterium]|nr:acyltransferase family protein [Lachnospiraceae bacterium]
MKKRITYLDLAKGFGIILVVLGHMENISSELRIWISSFHMPLFFVISGMLMSVKNEVGIAGEEVNLKLLTEKKAKGILVPYLWFSLIYIPIDIMNLFIENVDKHTFIQNVLDSVTLSGVSVMWFLPALFIAEITSIIMIKKQGELVRKHIDNQAAVYGIILLEAFVLSIFTFRIWQGIRPVYEAGSGSYIVATVYGFIRVILRGLCMSVHVVIGFVSFKLITFAEKKLDGKLRKEDGTRGLALALGVILFVINMGLCLKNSAVDNHFLTLNNLLLYYMCAFLGSMAIIMICKGLDTIPFIEFLGKNSLIIMATHLQCYLLYAGILIAIAIDAYVTRAKSYVYMFNSVLFTMLFEVIVIFVINRFFPFVTGKKSIKETFQFLNKNIN